MTNVRVVKAIPTRYGGTIFRSRLEARWAAFFDLAGWSWDYEPFDLEGWTPDFILHFAEADILVEVKPVPLVQHEFPAGSWALPTDPSFVKAVNHSRSQWVFLLGERPQSHSDLFAPGTLLDPPGDRMAGWHDVHVRLTVEDSQGRWREAGNAVQWRRG